MALRALGATPSGNTDGMSSHRPLPLCLALLLNAAAQAQTSAPPAPPAAPASLPAAPSPAQPQLDKVEVTSQNSDENRRRTATASKIVISRDDLLRFGDGNLSDLMRRLPGVTPGGRPGRGGEIRMRGMGGGFTQLLVNGERMAPGFSIDQIAPDQIERIEIQRAPTAETGARAVAGTINIILREPLVQKLHELRVTLGADHGEPQLQAAWTRNDAFGEDLRYSLTVVANHQRRFDDIDSVITTTTPELSLLGQTAQQGKSLDRRSSLNTNARLLWRLGKGESLTFMPFMVLARGSTDSRFSQSGVARYDAASSHNEGRFRMLRFGSQYQSPLGEGRRLELRANGGRTVLEGDSRRLETLAGATARTQDDHNENRDDNLSLAAKLNLQTDREHNWVSGLELEHGRRDNTRTTLEDGVPKPGLSDFGEQLAARTLRLAAFTQNEWQASPQWNLHGGLRYEQIESRGDPGFGATVRNTSRVWSPIAHALWKPDPKSRNQLRMSLTRSYRAANLGDLIARPSINGQIPSGPNTVATPDRAGNPLLEPELATGLEFGLEHYLAKGGLLSANLFARDISGLIRNVLALESVSWDASPRWVSRPRNLGKARVYGLELEAKARADELLDSAPAWLQLRANLSLFASDVQGIPGPHNRIDAQPRATANLGLDARIPESSWSLGGNWSWTPEVEIQQTEILRSVTSRRQVLDAYLQYAVRRDLNWRLGVSNAAPLDALTQTVVDSGSQIVRTDDRKRTFTSWNLRAEMRF